MFFLPNSQRYTPPYHKSGTPFSKTREQHSVTTNREYLEFEGVQFVASGRLNQGGPHRKG